MRAQRSNLIYSVILSASEESNRSNGKILHFIQDDNTLDRLCERSEAICIYSVILSDSEESNRSNGKILHYVQDDDNQRDRVAKEACDEVSSHLFYTSFSQQIRKHTGRR